MDYARVERAIQFLVSHHLGQPNLATVARHVHLSEYHFQRLFSRWAGISPKRFLQCLTVEHAKQRLAESKALLDVTLESGLSSPGRLHDLFVSVEAMTPNEFKERGTGLRIRYGLHPSPFGTCLLAITDRGVCGLSFVDGDAKSEAVRDLRSAWMGARFEERPEATAPVASAIFDGLSRGRKPNLALLLKGTNFQLKVWKALLQIPPGALVSYDTVARWIGESRAARAVANAVGTNPIAFLIPCHRVIRQSGILTGYRWGAARKRAILVWESADDSNTETCASAFSGTSCQHSANTSRARPEAWNNTPQTSHAISTRTSRCDRSSKAPPGRPARSSSPRWCATSCKPSACTPPG